MTPEPTPFQLVAAIHASDDEARSILERWCRPPVAALIQVMAGRIHPAGARPDLLTSRALRWLLMYLRSRDPASYRDLQRETFVKSLVLAAYRWLDPLRTDELAANAPRPIEPSPDTYDLRSYLRPLDDVGGDWWCHDGGHLGSLWVIVADVTGHGYPAYLIASGLPHLWRSRRIADLRATIPEPRDLLGALGRELESVLPDDLFVEATLGRFSSNGEALLAAAGGCQPILRRAGAGQAEFHSLSGCFLGLEYGDRDQRSWSLESGDELLLATDGLFDQPCGHQLRLKVTLPEGAGMRLAAGHDLHEAVLGVLDEALRETPQHDDITVVTLRRRPDLQALGMDDAGM